MKKSVLDRYTVDGDGRIVIDVSVAGIEDLFNDFDRAAPFLKKDLNPQFADYLMDCVSEIGNRKFALRIDLQRMPDEARMERVRKSIANYFMYLRELELRRLKGMAQTSFFLFGVGMILLAIDIWINRLLKESTSVVAAVFSEGLTIAAWVAIWEALANTVLQWSPQRHTLRMFQRLATAPVLFRDTLTPVPAS